MSQGRLFRVEQEVFTSDDYWTPKWIFDALDVVFDLDPCCSPAGALHTPCRNHYTQADDGLAQPWFGRVFMNPPYSKTTPWAHKFMSHRNGIALLPMAKSEWFNEIWDDCDAVVLLPKKTRFERPLDLPGSTFLPTALIAYGKQNVTALSNSMIGRVR